MEIVTTSGNDNIARVHVGKLSGGRYIEFVESLNPGTPRNKKWVIIISTLAGCPVGCPICDAGSVKYKGPLSKKEIFEQIDYLVDRHYPNRKIPVEKFKIQFARVGEPSLNSSVLDILDELPSRYDAPGLTPALSTIAPAGKEEFFERLIKIKERHYHGKFQLQFSIHSTSDDTRKYLIPISHWGFKQIKDFGERFWKTGDKKITLNFAAMKDVPIDAAIIAQNFSADKFLVKITPLNPTSKALGENLTNNMDLSNPEGFKPALQLRRLGFEVIVSVGELEENNIGSNCGQYITALSTRPLLQGLSDKQMCASQVRDQA